MFDSLSSPMFRYYVEMPHIFATLINNHEKDLLVVNLEDVIPKLNNLIGPNYIQEIVRFANLLLLPILPTKRRQGNEPLVDYSSSHVVASYQYLIVLK
jgi:hypothetical protein